MPSWFHSWHSLVDGTRISGGQVQELFSLVTYGEHPLLAHDSHCLDEKASFAGSALSAQFELSNIRQKEMERWDAAMMLD